MNRIHKSPAFLLLETAAKRRFLGVVMRVYLVYLSSLNAGKDWKEAIRWDDWLLAVSS